MSVAGLFAGQPTLRAIVEVGLEGRQGRIARDGEGARISLGCYEVFDGDPASPGARRRRARRPRRDPARRPGKPVDDEPAG
jgi:hypothetical protein